MIENRMKSDFVSSNLMKEQEILNYMFSSRKNASVLGQIKLENNHSYAHYQEVTKSSHDKMPTLKADKNLNLKNLKSSSRNMRDNIMPASMKSTELDHSILSKDASANRNLKNKQMMSFEKQSTYNNQNEQLFSKLVSKNSKNRMLAKLISLHNHKKNKDKINIKDEHNISVGANLETKVSYAAFVWCC